MPTTAKTIDAASPMRAKLLVSRNDTKGRLTLSTTMWINRRNTVVGSISLDAKGWHELLQCVAFPPEVTVDELSAIPDRADSRLFRRRCVASGNSDL